jgi:hypothetical protein
MSCKENILSSYDNLRSDYFKIHKNPKQQTPKSSKIIYQTPTPPDSPLLTLLTPDTPCCQNHAQDHSHDPEISIFQDHHIKLTNEDIQSLQKVQAVISIEGEP